LLKFAEKLECKVTFAVDWTNVSRTTYAVGKHIINYLMCAMAIDQKSAKTVLDASRVESLK